MKQSDYKKHGFTLIELAIVLVIVGLLVGGVLQGRDLIKQAQISSTISDITTYNTAVNTFRLKYNGIPGDIHRAYIYGLDRDETGTTNVSRTAATNYDGNNDGNLAGAAAFTSDLFWDGEMVNFWVHLSNTGLIKGSYGQIYGCYGFGTLCNGTPGRGYPETSVGNGIIVANGFDSGNTKMTKPLWYILGVGNSLSSISGSSEYNQNAPVAANLTTEEAFAIDSKLDDGKPAAGVIRYIAGMNCSGASCNPAGLFSNGVSGASKCASTGTTYNLTTSGNLCTLAIKTSF